MFIKVIWKNGNYDIIHATKFASVKTNGKEILFDTCNMLGKYETHKYSKSVVSFIYIMNDEGKTIDRTGPWVQPSKEAA